MSELAKVREWLDKWVDEHDLGGVTVGEIRSALLAAGTEGPGLRWFRYDPEDGIEFFETESEAREAAEGSLEACRDLAPSYGWPENTEEIVYGEIKGMVVETSRITREEWDRTHDTEDEPFPIGQGFDEMIDYEIGALAARPVEGEKK